MGFLIIPPAAGLLHKAGWSCGVVWTTTGWLVVGSNGENVIEARGRTQTEAWERAVAEARAVGMLRS